MFCDTDGIWKGCDGKERPVERRKQCGKGLEVGPLSMHSGLGLIFWSSGSSVSRRLELGLLLGMQAFSGQDSG